MSALGLECACERIACPLRDHPRSAMGDARRKLHSEEDPLAVPVRLMPAPELPHRRRHQTAPRRRRTRGRLQRSRPQIIPTSASVSSLGRSEPPPKRCHASCATDRYATHSKYCMSAKSSSRARSIGGTPTTGGRTHLCLWRRVLGLARQLDDLVVVLAGCHRVLAQGRWMGERFGGRRRAGMWAWAEGRCPLILEGSLALCGERGGCQGT
jgi:hypothetical protein